MHKQLSSTNWQNSHPIVDNRRNERWGNDLGQLLSFQLELSSDCTIKALGDDVLGNTHQISTLPEETHDIIPYLYDTPVASISLTLAPDGSALNFIWQLTNSAWASASLAKWFRTHDWTRLPSHSAGPCWQSNETVLSLFVVCNTGLLNKSAVYHTPAIHPLTDSDFPNGMKRIST